MPKKLVGTNGELTGERNDVALAGLNHKMGNRGIPNTLLNFGEGKFPVRADGAGGASKASTARAQAPSATWSASRTKACAACST